MLYTISELRAIVSPLAQRYGADRVYLFGSYARGDMHSGSDIDLRIDKGSIHGLQLATTGMDQRFLETIRPDEVLLYERARA